MRARGARRLGRAQRPAAGPRARQLGRLDRLLPDRPLARRPGAGGALARPLPQPRARLGARHRPRLPARHPREADRRASASATAASTRRSSRASRPTARAARSATSARRSACRSRELERLARLTDGNPYRVGEELAKLPGRRRQARIAALARLRPALRRDRRPAAPHLAAPGRDGDLDAAAGRARAGAARGDGRAAALPVGQGLVRRRRLPEDRPARARDALGGRGLRRADRASRTAKTIDLSRIPLDDQERLRRDPGGRHGRRLPDREPRADADAAAHAAGEPRRPDDPGRARAAGPDPGRRRPSVHRQPPAAARGPGVRAAERPPAAGGAAARDARRDRLPGPGARGRDGAGRLLDRRGRGAAPRDEPEALAGGDRGVPRPLRRGRASAGRRAGRSRTRSSTSSSASRASASRSRTRPRSRCSRTSRRGCGTTTRPSSSARC